MRATGWNPLEISIVGIPADNSIGIGRSETVEFETEVISLVREAEETPAEAEIKPEIKIKEVRKMEPNEKIDVQAATDKAVNEEKKRVADILAMGRKYDMVEEAESLSILVSVAGQNIGSKAGRACRLR